jgi:hypothetical protein
MKIFRTKRVIYRIETNEDGTLTVFREYTSAQGFWQKDGRKYPNAGLLISQTGGIDPFLAKCEDIEDVEKYVHDINVEKKAAKDASADQEQDKAASAKEAYDQVFCNDVTETTAETVCVLLRYLNTKNLGSWQLPKMTIGYVCNQYDCDGRTATTIKLDQPIPYGDEMVSQFQFGAPRGHLVKYHAIR